MDGKADLHIHTTFSDGFYTPEEIVSKAKSSGLDAISITDHDSLNAFAQASEAGKKMGIEVIPGVEISTDIQGKEIHILAYYIEPGNPEIERYLEFFRDERINRAERIIRKLNNLGFSISMEDVLKHTENRSVGRPHIAQAMVDKGVVSNFYEAFNKYIGNDCPAYEKKVHISPKSAFKIINDAGGLSFIAHPANMAENLIKELIEVGVDGIEVYHPSHSSQQVRFYKGIVNEYFLLESGGSDFHGGRREDEKNFGKYFANYSCIEAMRTRLIRNTA